MLHQKPMAGIAEGTFCGTEPSQQHIRSTRTHKGRLAQPLGGTTHNTLCSHVRRDPKAVAEAELKVHASTEWRSGRGGQNLVGGEEAGLYECRVATHSPLPPQQWQAEGYIKTAACEADYFIDTARREFMEGARPFIKVVKG